jgi:hypothetical protein
LTLALGPTDGRLSRTSTNARRINISIDRQMRLPATPLSPGRVVGQERSSAAALFAIWNLNLRSDIDVSTTKRLVRPWVGHDRADLSLANTDLVGPIGVGLASA